MLNTKQCAAPIGNNLRCKNITADGVKIHCNHHHTNAVKLYKKYKKACEFANTFIIDDVHTITSDREKIIFLNKCYVACIDAYNKRMEHRNRYVVPDCRDWGHDQQFIRLKQKADTCELLLETLYSEITLKHRERENVLVSEETEIKDDHVQVEDTFFMEEVKKFKKKRVDDEKETNRIIEAYIRENAKELRSKKKLIELCYSKLSKYTTHNAKYEYEHMMCIIMVLFDLERKIESRNKFPFDCDYTKIATLVSAKINAHINIKELFSDQHMDFLIELNETFDYFDDKSIIIDSVLSHVRKIWEETDFEPLHCKYKYIFTSDGKFIFNIINLPF